jgi:hypothetical protein
MPGLTASAYDFRFLPGAFGFPARGDRSFDAFTISSKSDLGTFMSLRMIPLNVLNSGVASNLAAVMGGGCVSAGVLLSPRLELIGYLPILAGQLLVGESPSNNVPHREDEALNVGHVAVVVAKRLFIEIPEEVKRLHAYIGPMNASLEQTPNVLKPVRMNVAVDIRLGVVDHLMLKFIKAVIRLQRIAEQFRSDLNILAHHSLKFRLAARGANLRANCAAALPTLLLRWPYRPARVRGSSLLFCRRAYCAPYLQ